MPDEKAPSLGAFLPSSLMHHLSGEPMYDLSGVDTPSSELRQSPTSVPIHTVVHIGEVPNLQTWHRTDSRRGRARFWRVPWRA
jgi:hypothetical protein